MQGFIKLYRCLLENPIFKNPNLLQLFIYCLLKANHKEGKAFLGKNEITVNPGQFITGRFELSSALRQNESSTYKRLKRLESLRIIGLKSNNKNTIVTIVNWDIYQTELLGSNNKVTTKEQQSNNKVTTKEQQSNTNKNVRMEECKNGRKNIYAEFVSMTEKEYQKLISKHGEEFTKKCIEALDNYKGAKGRKYKSDYRAILSWVIDKVNKENPNKSNLQKQADVLEEWLSEST